MLILLKLLVVALVAVSAAEAAFTVEETIALEQFRPMVSSILYKDYMFNDDYLIRWLRAQNLDLNKAKEMLEKNIQWRIDESIDGLLNETFSDQVKECTPFDHAGVDRNGRPITYAYEGRWNVQKCAWQGRMDEMIRYTTREALEWSENAVRHAVDPTSSKNVTQFVTISDFGGFSLIEGACPICLRLYIEHAQITENYYPQLGYKFFIMNAPPGFEVLLAILRPFMSEATYKAFYVLPREQEKYLPILLEYIAPDQLLTAYGGELEL